jgi:hypothetical protein
MSHFPLVKPDPPSVATGSCPVMGAGTQTGSHPALAGLPLPLFSSGILG